MSQNQLLYPVSPAPGSLEINAVGSNSEGALVLQDRSVFRVPALQATSEDTATSIMPLWIRSDGYVFQKIILMCSVEKRFSPGLAREICYEYLTPQKGKSDHISVTNRKGNYEFCLSCMSV